MATEPPGPLARVGIIDNFRRKERESSAWRQPARALGHDRSRSALQLVEIRTFLLDPLPAMKIAGPIEALEVARRVRDRFDALPAMKIAGPIEAASPWTPTRRRPISLPAMKIAGPIEAPIASRRRGRCARSLPAMKIAGPIEARP